MISCATPVSPNSLKPQVLRTSHYIVLGLALCFVLVTLSALSPSRAQAASPSIAIVQDRNTEVTSGTTASLPFSKANTAGDLIVVYVVWDNPGSVTVTDTNGNTYAPATTRRTWGNNWSSQVFYASNIRGGSNTVKATFSTGITSFGLEYLHEYSGAASVSPVDVSASGVGTSAAMSSGAVATTQASDLLFGAGASDDAVTSPGAGFTKRLTGYGNLTEDRVVTTTGSYAATAKQNGATWVMQLVAFRAASSATGPPTKLAFVQSPTSTVTGTTLSPAVTVAVEDANGNIVTTDNATTVSLAIGTNPAGGNLSGGAAVTVASGIATFSGLSIDTPGTGYTLTASSTPSYSKTTSAAFNITGVGPPTKLAFVQSPTSTVTGTTLSPAVTVAVEDANGNIVTTDNATTVSLAIGTNPAGGNLSGGAAVTVASGIATFSGLSIDTPGTGYTLTASSTPSYSKTTSAAFNITVGTPSSDWTSYMGGNARTNSAAGEAEFNPTSVTNLGLAWQASDVGPSHGVFSQPIVSNGLVYWGSFDGYERATDTSGQPVWKTNLGTTSPPGCTDPSEAGVVSTPTITTDVPVNGAASVLYVGGGDGKLYALNAATGAVLWSTALGPNSNYFIWSSPAVLGNSVYIGLSSFGDCPLVQGQLIQLNRVTGAVEHTFNTVPNGCTGGGVWGSPTVDAATGTIYFATGNGGSCGSSEPYAPAVVEVNASDLSLVGSWAVPPAQQNTDSDFGSTPTLFTGVIGGQPQPLVGLINKNGFFYTFIRGALASGPV